MNPTPVPSSKPNMAAYERHLLLCTGPYCDPDGKAAALYQKLPGLLGDLARYQNPCRVKRGTTPCLGVCVDGPLVVVYPEGIWYHRVDEPLLARIVEEHLRENRPVESAMFHHLKQPLTHE